MAKKLQPVGLRTLMSWGPRAPTTLILRARPVVTPSPLAPVAQSHSQMAVTAGVTEAGPRDADKDNDTVAWSGGGSGESGAAAAASTLQAHTAWPGQPRGQPAAPSSPLHHTPDPHVSTGVPSSSHL